jgi:hypothetical protein
MWMRIVGRIVLAFVGLWLLFAGAMFWWMHQPINRFAGFMGKVPGPVMMAIPFETLWSHARTGKVGLGEPAPNFTLPTLDKKSEVSLASFRGSKPVVLIFGSYT